MKFLHFPRDTTWQILAGFSGQPWQSSSPYAAYERRRTVTHSIVSVGKCAPAVERGLPSGLTSYLISNEASMFTMGNAAPECGRLALRSLEYLILRADSPSLSSPTPASEGVGGRWGVFSWSTFFRVQLLGLFMWGGTQSWLHHDGGPLFQKVGKKCS